MLPDIHKRVVNAKYVLERAAGIQAESDEMSLSVALLLMHDAVELLMLAVLDHLQLAAKKNHEFMDFWTLIRDAGRPEPSDKIPMDSLNKLRVGLKHYGNQPNPQTARDLLPRARGFFENVLQAYCGTSYQDVSLIELVPDQEVRSILQEAQTKFPSDKPSALASLKIALHRLENPDGKHLALLQPPPKPRLSSEMARAGWEQYLSQLHSFLNESASRANAARLGIDPVRYAAFVRNTPIVQWSNSGKSTVIHTSTYQHVSEDDFNEMLTFLIDYALKASVAYVSLPRASTAQSATNDPGNFKH
jgi:hypothetical protein